MALTCKEGTLERNESRYMYYLKEDADLGQQDAQEELATAYNRRNNEQEQILHYATLMTFISMVESEAKSHCTNCRKEAGSSPLKRCIRCLGAWYCGKECQVQHWTAGDKFDCIKSQ
eukprot:scaffold3649_cov102-Skeletonema_dohrnii-CCMP3373.AAC.10